MKPARRLLFGKIFKRLALGLGVLLILAQFYPYGREHSNPAVIKEPAWDSLKTRELAKRACFDCHSNETTWPWYAYVAPISWLVQDDVEEGRARLNFSEWNRPWKKAHESAEEVADGDMPMWYYVIPHPSADLSEQEKSALIRGLSATFGEEENDHGSAEHHEHDDDDDD